MRDDLHTTVPVSKPWKRVLRIAPRLADRERLAEEVQLAVGLTLAKSIRAEWANGLREDLVKTSSDLFGEQQQPEVLSRYEAASESPGERRLCEIAKGLHARDGGKAELFDRAFAECFAEEKRNNLEHLVAKVRETHGLVQARQIREALEVASSKAPSGVLDQSTRKRDKPTVEELLAQPLATPRR